MGGSLDLSGVKHHLGAEVNINVRFELGDLGRDLDMADGFAFVAFNFLVGGFGDVFFAVEREDFVAIALVLLEN